MRYKNVYIPFNQNYGISCYVLITPTEPNLSDGDELLELCLPRTYLPVHSAY